MFHMCYRMQPCVFNRMVHDVVNHDPYSVKKKKNTLGRLNFSIEQKLTCTLRMLAYGLSIDLFDEFQDMAKFTTLQILQHFTKAIWNVYHEEYLRQPTKADLRLLLDKVAAKGFSGMVGSLDCMHWQWKNCHSGWHGRYADYKGKPTIILEAVASYDT